MAGTINNIQISGYDPDVSYEQYDVVSTQTGRYPDYYVSTSGSNSGTLDDVTYLSNASWKRFDDPDFLFNDVWTPSFQTAVNGDLKPKLAPYGDGYAQRSDLSVFFNKWSEEMTFENIQNRELKSLVSLFEYKGGVEFIKVDIPPFMTGRKYVGRNWKHTYISDNINNFSTSLFEFISDKNV